jgi:hypothetical protein
MNFSCAMSSENGSQHSNELKYAVAYCLSKSYPDSEFSKDAAYISGAYLQNGVYGINMYEEIRSFVDVYRNQPLASKHDKNLNIMQCVNLYEFVPLKNLINGVAKKFDVVGH